LLMAVAAFGQWRGELFVGESIVPPIFPFR
jgi:hypothetical protein